MNQNPYNAPNSDSTGSKVVLGCTIAGAIGIGLMLVLVAGVFLFSARSSGPQPVAPVPSVQPVPLGEAAPPRRPDPQEVVIPEPPPSLELEPNPGGPSAPAPPEQD